jgi:hypothetical protein
MPLAYHIHTTYPAQHPTCHGMSHGRQQKPCALRCRAPAPRHLPVALAHSVTQQQGWDRLHQQGACRQVD